jgi:hypothetical protein
LLIGDDQVLVIYMQSRHGWRSENANAAEGDGSERRALEYPGAEAPYRDHPDVEDVEDNDAVLASRVVPSRLRDDSEHWA